MLDQQMHWADLNSEHSDILFLSILEFLVVAFDCRSKQLRAAQETFSAILCLCIADWHL